MHYLYLGVEAHLLVIQIKASLFLFIKISFKPCEKTNSYAMKKILMFLITLFSVMYFSSCNKEEKQGDSTLNQVGTSYWVADITDNNYNPPVVLGKYYLGFEEITEEDRNEAPMEINDTYTSGVLVETPNRQASGFASKTNDEINVLYLLYFGTGAELPTKYTLTENGIVCTYDGKVLEFTQITKDEFYNSTTAF